MLKTVFLQANQLTIPTQMHDYPEWHKGRMHYALWYIEIVQPELLLYLSALRNRCAEFLVQPNIRQFHITLFICGFLSQNKIFDDDFSQSDFQQQMQSLLQQEIRSFRLKTGQIRSFNSALFVEIIDEHNSLSKIRTLFSDQYQEIAALDYCPHITLGLYSDAIEGQIVYSEIDQLAQRSFDIDVKHLTFGHYEAKILQGQLYPEQLMELI
ncbi:2'-5' RNA ligase family protein [Acinetobacter chinensis]|uniref:2'-5' RNA ligase family protein n=1 Tax=Acinetobacter chinensis TaxID=2004650 RepID=A0A3B7LUZ4_9GAMM|nr:2'-5' RNA ligase family protein [Acinetobacter chinensis]AXY56672.1 2'-5' RNA ligase family protein [Acinetobacter chinensis]